MRQLIPSQSKSPQSWTYPVFRGSDENIVNLTRRIGFLIDSWLRSQDQFPPNPQVASRVERKLHDAIKAGPLYGQILSFAGLNLWVDDRTADGLVMTQESINL